MSSWKSIAQEKAASVLALIPQEWRIDNIPSREAQPDVTGHFIQQYLSKDEIEITETDAVGIVAKTSTGAWTAVEVARAFCHRAAIAHQLVNCLHEIFFDAALADAARTDEYFAEHKKPMGILHGLPVSLKDQFHVKGVETHMGYVGWIGTFQGEKGTGKEKVYESEMVKELRSLGATLYCKTSVPHTLMCGETVNNIIEYTYNPKNRHLSAGGSSGGEGALISLRGSPCGFGTDIGGSIRLPAGFNGLYGIRPTSGRLPYYGMANSYDGQNSILSVAGPLTTTPDALKLMVSSILSTKPWLHDPLVTEIPWRAEQEKLKKQNLSFGVMRDDAITTPHPPVARAIDMVAKVLSGLGHETIDWRPDVHHSDLTRICGEVWQFDGGADAAKAFELSGESPANGVLYNPGPAADAIEIMKVNIEKRELQKRYLEYWNSTSEKTSSHEPVDAILCPVAPFTAARPQAFTYYGYTSFVNALDYTSVVIPVTIVDKNIDKRYENFKALNADDQKTQDTCKSSVRAMNPADSDQMILMYTMVHMSMYN